MVSGYGKTTHYYAVMLCTKFGVLGNGAGDTKSSPCNVVLERFCLSRFVDVNAGLSNREKPHACVGNAYSSRLIGKGKSPDEAAEIQ
jgi:hypothetical protein